MQHKQQEHQPLKQLHKLLQVQLKLQLMQLRLQVRLRRKWEYNRSPQEQLQQQLVQLNE